LKHVSGAPFDHQSIANSLRIYAKETKKDESLIIRFEEKVNNLIIEGYNEQEAIGIAICWLYTLEAWVYKDLNSLLREDSSLLEKLASYANGIIHTYKTLGSKIKFYSGMLYRRTQLTPNQIKCYVPHKTFLWASFTSTTTLFDTSAQFGDILFVVEVPQKFQHYAMCLDNFSDFPAENEVLLAPNVAYNINSVEKGPTIQFPCTSLVITITAVYVCIT